MRGGLEGTILKINGVTTSSIEELSAEISKYSEGDEVVLNVLGADGDDYDRDLILGKHPYRDGAWLGISFSSVNAGLLKNLLSSLSPSRISSSNACSKIFIQSNTCYAPTMGGFSYFIYDLIRWLIIICLSVALINMLPVGIFDGGRFFYLTILALTKKKKVAKKVFQVVTYFFLFLLVFLMILWLKNVV